MLIFVMRACALLLLLLLLLSAAVPYGYARAASGTAVPGGPAEARH